MTTVKENKIKLDQYKDKICLIDNNWVGVVGNIDTNLVEFIGCELDNFKIDSIEKDESATCWSTRSKWRARNVGEFTMHWETISPIPECNAKAYAEMISGKTVYRIDGKWSIPKKKKVEVDVDEWEEL